MENNPLNVVPVTITNSNKTSFQYNWNTNEIDLKPSDQISYYFELYDNDGINGPKSVKSNVLSLKLPSKEELEEANSKTAMPLKMNSKMQPRSK